MAEVDTQLSSLTDLENLQVTDLFLVRRNNVDFKTYGESIRRLGIDYGNYTGSIDDIATNSIYFINVSTADSNTEYPSEDVTYWIVRTQLADASGDWRIQDAYAYNTGRIYTRIYANSQWYSWMSYANNRDWITIEPTVYTPTISWSNGTSLVIENSRFRYWQQGYELTISGRFQITSVGSPNNENLVISLPTGYESRINDVIPIGTLIMPDGTCKGVIKSVSPDIQVVADPAGNYSSALITTTGYYGINATAYLR